MSLDPSTLESDLRRLRPAALDESLLERLDACAAGTWNKLDPAEIASERKLAGYTPLRLPAALTISLEATMAEVTFPNEVKIVPFPKNETTAPGSQRGWWGAAAAVALMGAFGAFLVPVGQQKPQVVAGSPQVPAVVTAPSNDKLVPAGFNRGLREARDEGVVWQSDQEPHRVLKVVYNDRVTLKDAQGRTVEVDVPQVEYILVPAKTD